MIKTLYQLLFKSKSILISISMILLPILLTLIIGSMLFVNNLLYSYKAYLEKSYIGLQPKVYIKSDPIFIDKLYQYAKAHNIKASKSIHLSQIVKINNYKKRVKFIVLNREFLKKKFHTTSIAINSIFFKDIKKPTLLQSDEMKQPLLVNPKVVIPTGFLTNSSIIFISKKLYKKHFKKIAKEQILEIEDDITPLKEAIQKYAKKYSVMKLSIHKRINKIKESKELFEKIDLIKNIIIVIIFIFAIAIITLSFSIVIEIKKREIDILRTIGISTDKFYKFLLSITLISVSISMIFGYVLYLISKEIFQRFININEYFSIINDTTFLFYMALFIPLTIIIVYINLKIDFKDRM